jgi:hypothetical protein
MVRANAFLDVAKSVLTSVADSQLSNNLEKMTIESYADIQLQQFVDSIEVMYNPAEIPLNFSAEYRESSALNSVANPPTFVEVRPTTLEIPLIFDAQLHNSLFSVAMDRDIEGRLKKLKRMCGMIDSKTLETRYLKLKWGRFEWMGAGYFSGRMQQLSVRYTLFDRHATPLRASASLSLIEDQDPERVKSELGLSSRLPKVMRVIGDMSMDAVAHQLTGSVDNAFELARQNNKSSLAKLGAGTVLKWVSNKGK